MSFLHTFRHEHSRVCVMTARRLLFITSVIGSVVEYNVANVVARVRFPDDAFFVVSKIIANQCDHTTKLTLLI